MIELASLLSKGGPYAAFGLLIVILGAGLIILLKYVVIEEKDKRNNTEAKVDSTETKVHELQLLMESKISDSSKEALQQITGVEERINARIDKIENKIGGIVTGDIAQLYREITTLQGDIKVLANELKNLNSNIKTLFDTMSSDIRNTIADALSVKQTS